MEAIKGHMVQSSQGVRSTKKKGTRLEAIKMPHTGLHYRNNMKRNIYQQPSKQNNSTSGINPSVNSTLMIVGDYRLDPELVIST